jgi:hypothetical protein
LAQRCEWNLKEFVEVELTPTEALRAYARMINTLDASPLEPLLADDFHYASQNVVDEIRSKKEFLDYIEPKLRVMARSGSPVFAEMGDAARRLRRWTLCRDGAGHEGRPGGDGVGRNSGWTHHTDRSVYCSTGRGGCALGRLPDLGRECRTGWAKVG